MYNTYISSSISLRTKGSLSFSINDYSNERFEKTPLSQSSSCCCACCGCCCCNHRELAINPSLLYGLRQSSLIQRSPSRRLVLGGGADQYINRVYSIDRGCYEVSCYVKERVVGARSGRRRDKGRFGEKKSKCRSLGGDVEAEVLLSLLTEEVGEECFGVKGRSVGSSKRVQVEKRGNVDDQCYRRKKKNVGLGSLRGNSNCELESVAVELREECSKQNEEKGGSLRGENHRAKKEGSSCSSYYSLLSSGDFEIDSESEVQCKDDGYAVDSSSARKKDIRQIGKSRGEDEVVEEVERYRDDKEESGEVTKPQTTVGGSNVEWDWRKKSEKKLTEEFVDQKKSVKESSQEASVVSGVQRSGYRKASVSKKRFDDMEEKFTLAGTSDEETRGGYSLTGSQIIGQFTSRINQQGAELSEVDGSAVHAQIISHSQKQFRGREENVSAAANLGQITSEVQKKSQEPVGRFTIKNIDCERASDLQRRSETRLKSQEEQSTSVGEANEQLHQKGEWKMGQISSRRNFQEISNMSENRDGNNEETSISHWQSQDGKETWEESAHLISSSQSEAKEQLYDTDRTGRLRTEQRKGSQDMTSSLVVHVSDTEKISDHKRVSEKRMGSQGTYSTSSAMKSAEETTDRQNQTDERLVQRGSRKEAERLTNVSSFHESTSEGASTSSLQASLNLASQFRLQQGYAQETYKSSQEMSMPPPPQLEARGSFHIEATSGLTTKEASTEVSEKESNIMYYTQANILTSPDEVYGGGGRSENYGEPVNVISPEDALGSADRLEKSSMHFIGEFVEKVRHEVSTSEILKEKQISKAKSEYEGEKLLQTKEHDSRRSSGASRTKGPSVEMWDVTESSVKEPPKTETPEDSITTGNTITKRSSRSLWSIMADVVRMRWTSHSESRTSAIKSSGKNSSNESISSETWFSGHEPDEDNDDYVKKEKGSRLQASTSSEQQQLGQTPMKSQEGSDIMSAKDKIRQIEIGTSSSSVILESSSASLGTSLVSDEENVGLSGNRKSNQGTPSSSVMVESSLPLPSRQLRRSPAVEEFSGTGKAEVSESGSMEQQELPLSPKLTEVSGTEGKDAELKRRKLQRNKQVVRDRFDEWEDAHNRESKLRKMDEMFMREALLEAKKAADTWEVPVGAVLVQHGKIIARGCNLVEELRDSTAHAEMICIREASNVLRTWRLADTILYVTLEPCPMCAGAILQARIDTIVWGAPNKLLGADGSWIRLFPDGDRGTGSDLTDKPPAPVHPFHPKITIRRGVLASECADVMQQFFQLRRRNKGKNSDPPTPPSRLAVSSHPSKLLTKVHELFNIMFCL